MGSLPPKTSPEGRAAVDRRLSITIAAVLAALAPLLLLRTVGLLETWDAFDRYTAALLTFSNEHPLEAPTGVQGAPPDFAQFDAALVSWHRGLQEITSKCESMAVVGLIASDDNEIELQFDKQAGSSTRALKSAFHWQRDGALGAYFALSVLAYFSKSIPLAALVLALNACNLAVCARLKGMTDALLKAAEQLPLSEFLLLPLETAPQALQQQTLTLLKLRALTEMWNGMRFCFNITVPGLGSLSVSVALMASLAAATSVRCGHRIIRGLHHLLAHPSRHHHHGSHAALSRNGEEDSKKQE